MTNSPGISWFPPVLSICQVVKSDFEQALRIFLPGAEIDGCYFHFCQAFLRNVNQVGNNTDYKAITTDPATGMKLHSPLHARVRWLTMLALVGGRDQSLFPTSDVPDIFNQIVSNIPDTLQIGPLPSPALVSKLRNWCFAFFSRLEISPWRVKVGLFSV